MNIKVTYAVTSMALVAALGGCGNAAAGPSTGGGSISPATPAASPSGGDNLLAGDPAVKACELVPKSDLETLLGETFSDGVPGPGNCKTYSDDGSGGIVYISVGDWTTFRSAAQANHPGPLAGLGDEALKADDNALYVRVGARGLFVQFTAASEKDPGRLLARGKSVADSLVSRLRAGPVAGGTATPVP
jgi:hypothetical protein